MNSSSFEQLMRKMIPITSAVVVLVFFYVGWVFYSRHRDVREEEELARVKEAENAKYTVEKYGGDRAKILAFSLSAGAIRAGQPVQLCYGVANAKTVKIEPPVGEVWPSMSRCMDVKPQKDTTYVLTVEDKAGHTDSAQLAIKVLR